MEASSEEWEELRSGLSSPKVKGDADCGHEPSMGIWKAGAVEGKRGCVVGLIVSSPNSCPPRTSECDLVWI